MFDFFSKNKSDPNQQVVGPAVAPSVPVSSSVTLELPQTEERSVVDDLKELMKYKPASTGYERFKAIFLKNEYGFRSYEFSISRDVAMIGALAVFSIRFTKNLRPGVERFKRQHSLSKFLSHKDAQQRAASFSIANAFYAGYPAGLRTGLFIFTFSLSAQSLAAFRDKMYYMDIVLGGYAAGALYRCFSGLKAVAVSSAVGGIGGVFYCIAFWCALKISGESTDIDVIYKKARQEFYEYRLKQHQMVGELQQIIDEENVWPYQAKKLYKERKQIETDRMKNQLVETK